MIDVWSRLQAHLDHVQLKPQSQDYMTDVWSRLRVHLDHVQLKSKSQDYMIDVWSRLQVHLDNVQPKSQSQDYMITSGSAIWLQNSNWARTWANSKDAKKLFQDRWLKDIAYKEWVLKDKLDKHYAWSMACKIQLIFCSLLLWWSLQNLILALTSPYKVLV